MNIIHYSIRSFFTNEYYSIIRFASKRLFVATLAPVPWHTTVCRGGWSLVTPLVTPPPLVTRHLSSPLVCDSASPLPDCPPASLPEPAVIETSQPASIGLLNWASCHDYTGFKTTPPSYNLQGSNEANIKYFQSATEPPGWDWARVTEGSPPQSRRRHAATRNTSQHLTCRVTRRRHVT